MIEERDLVTALLGFVTLVFLLKKLPRFEVMPHNRALVGSFMLIVIAWWVVVLQEVAPTPGFVVLEEIGRITSTAMLTFWCWRLSRGSEMDEPS